MCFWIAGRCACQRESVVTERLRLEGFHVYLPRARVRLPRSGRPAVVVLYAGYFFVDIDRSSAPWQAAKRMPGVTTVLMTGDAPSRCPDSEIEKLRASEIDGLVQLAGPPPSSDQKFTEGQEVRIRYGAFDNREARYARPDKRNMSVVMVVLLNRVVAVQVPTCALAASA
jgi:transcription antitermination factor NusG